MKRLLPYLLFIAFPAAAQVNFTDSNLPIIVIGTNNQVIQDDPRIVADMGIIYNGPNIRNYMTDPFNNYSGKIAIEIRGSTSQQYPKVSYGVETQDSLGNNLNVSLLGLPPENDWILYGAYPDKTLMRNEITYDIFRKMGHYDPRTVFCELVINGQYKGVYTLVERIKRDPNRVNIANLLPVDTAGDELTGGYIIKVDKTTGNSNTTWTSQYNNKVKYLYHDPEDVDLVQVQRDYIKNYVKSFETLMNGPGYSNPITGYPSVIETSSFIDFMIMQELGRTVDGYRSSSFLFKDKNSNGGLLRAGPMWDFNLSYGNCDYCAAFDTTGYQYDFNTICGSNFSSNVPFWWRKFLQDTNYCNQLRCRWDYLRSTVLHSDTIDAWIDATAAYLNESQQRNFTQWPILGQYVNWNYFVGNTYQEELDYLKWWFRSRSEWLDINWPGTCWNVSVNESPRTYVTYQLYPNPAKEWFMLRIDKPFKVENAVFVLMDITGREVLRINDVNTNELLVACGELSSGLYLYSLSAGSSLLVKGKVVVSE